MDPSILFKGICFFWAGIAIVSRIAMALMREKWKVWEITSAYSQKKPVWIYALGVFGVLLIGLTWFAYVYYRIDYGWILAVLISLTLVKILNLLFNYNQFREFVRKALNNKQKMLRINISVLFLAAVLILMGIFLY
ncbi:MAG: hypothetical protein ACLFNZ_03070 [Spirochaetaceae bacterium]